MAASGSATSGPGPSQESAAAARWGPGGDRGGAYSNMHFQRLIVAVLNVDFFKTKHWEISVQISLCKCGRGSACVLLSCARPLQLECGSVGLILVTFCMTLVLLYFWSEAKNDYDDFDW